MIDQKIDTIAAKVHAATNLPEPVKAELLELLSSLRSEVQALSQTHEETAHSIAGFADVSTHEGTRSEKKPELLENALEGLAGSVQELETSHPKLVETVNRITVILSNMGI